MKTTKLVIFGLLLLCKIVVAETSPDFNKLQKAVVAVQAKAVSPSRGNKPITSQGTGFFISKDGFLVTSLHLMRDLGTVDEETVQYEVRFPPPSTAVFQAAPLFINPAADILVLYASVAHMDVQTLARGDRNGVIPGSTSIFTMGFPAGYNISFDRGIIKSFGAISPIPVWSSNITFKNGQSGSPILLENGKVIAIAKGNDADATSIGLIVPIRLIPADYWDGLSADTAKALQVSETESGGKADRVIIEAAAPALSTKITEKRTFLIDKSVPACGSISEHHVIPATAGWKIDPASAEVLLSSVAGGDGQASLQGASSEGLDIATDLKSNGCIKYFGIATKAGLPARLVATVSYMETRVVSGAEFQTVSVVKAVVPVKVPLPNSGALRYSLVSEDGTSKPFTPKLNEISIKDGEKTLDIEAVKSRIK